jgi:hypothetical protein
MTSMTWSRVSNLPRRRTTAWHSCRSDSIRTCAPAGSRGRVCARGEGRDIQHAQQRAHRWAPATMLRASDVKPGHAGRVLQACCRCQPARRGTRWPPSRQPPRRAPPLGHPTRLLPRRTSLTSFCRVRSLVSFPLCLGISLMATCGAAARCADPAACAPVLLAAPHAASHARRAARRAAAGGRTRQEAAAWLTRPQPLRGQPLPPLLLVPEAGAGAPSGRCAGPRPGTPRQSCRCRCACPSQSAAQNPCPSPGPRSRAPLARRARQWWPGSARCCGRPARAAPGAGVRAACGGTARRRIAAHAGASWRAGGPRRLPPRLRMLPVGGIRPSAGRAGRSPDPLLRDVSARWSCPTVAPSAPRAAQVQPPPHLCLSRKLQGRTGKLPNRQLAWGAMRPEVLACSCSNMLVCSRLRAPP